MCRGTRAEQQQLWLVSEAKKLRRANPRSSLTKQFDQKENIISQDWAQAPTAALSPESLCLAYLPCGYALLMR